MNKRKMSISVKCTAVLLAVIFALAGCSNEASVQEQKAEGISLDMAVSDGIYTAFQNKFWDKEGNFVLGRVFFTDYHGEQIPVSFTDTVADITLYSRMDIHKLSQLTWIKELHLSDSRECPITSLACIKNLTQLEALTVYGDIKDISALSNLTKLKKLSVGGNKISNISVLSKLTELEELSLSYNKISDISALSELTKLKDLNLIRNKISDISSLTDLTALEYLRLQENEISDVSPLAGHTNLSFLALDGNPIGDISPLASLDSQTEICLRGTNLAWDDWEPVKHIGTVNGRPPVENAGAISCPQDWVDRIYTQYPDGMIISLDYDDYDKDGVYEAFALVSDKKEPFSDDSGYTGALLMITDDSMQELLRGWRIDVGGYFWFGDTKVIFANNYVAVTSSVSYLWTVEGSKPRTMNLSTMGQWFYLDEFGNVCILHSAYDGSSDGSGHSYKPYFFYFDGYNFVEYGAIAITEEEFLRCEGAEEVLEEIQEEGLELTEILYRGNVMIHINLRKYWEEESTGKSENTKEDTRYYSNRYKTFHLSEDGQLILIDSDMGYYHDCYSVTKRVSVEYPDRFPLQR